MKRIILLGCILFGGTLSSFANDGQGKQLSDTIRLNISEIEQQFINQNLSLLAAKYDIDIAKTNVLQAKLWYNPSIQYQQGAYSVENKQLNGLGSHDAQINQLISIAGKHTNTVALAKLAETQSELAFNELFRSLKYDLYTNFSLLYSTQKKIKLYESEIKSLNQLIDAAQQQFKLGAIAGNEVIRLKAEMQNLKNESITIELDLFNAEKNLKTLLNLPAAQYIELKPIALPQINNYTVDEVLTMAEKSRPDYLLSKSNIAYQNKNLQLQKSQRISDVTLSGIYNESSNSVNNFIGFGVAMGLPVFDRNQGNVRAAKLSVEKAIISDSLNVNSIENEVVSAYNRLVRIENQVRTMDPAYTGNIDQLLSYAINNYNKRYVSLLEFLDQLRTYTNAKLSLIELNDDYFNAAHYLNYTIGQDIVK